MLWLWGINYEKFYKLQAKKYVEFQLGMVHVEL